MSGGQSDVALRSFCQANRLATSYGSLLQLLQARAKCKQELRDNNFVGGGWWCLLHKQLNFGILLREEPFVHA